MPRTLTEFENNNPADHSGNMLVFINDGYQAQAVNITNVDSDNKSLRFSLSQLISVTLNLLGVERIITPLTAKNKNSYWHFTIEPIDLSGEKAAITAPNSTISSFFALTSQSSGQTLLISRSIYEEEAKFNPVDTAIEFELSEYEATENNTEIDRSIGFIYEVDRATTNIVPSNLSAILNDTATPASFQLSNHTTVGIKNSRYNGAKTSITDYGINSAINAKGIKAAIYVSSSTNTFICSQSDAVRNIENVLFSIPENYLATEAEDYGINPTSGSRIFTLSGNQIIPLRNRKVFLESNRTIVYINQDGYTLNKGTECT